MARLVGVFSRGKGESGEIPALLIICHCGRTGGEKLRHIGWVAEIKTETEMTFTCELSKKIIRRVQKQGVEAGESAVIFQMPSAGWGYNRGGNYW